MPQTTLPVPPEIAPQPSGSAIAAPNDTYAVPANQPTSVRAAQGVLANDHGGTGALGAVVQGLPGHGTLSMGVDGAFEYIPTGDLRDRTISAISPRTATATRLLPR